MTHRLQIAVTLWLTAIFARGRLAIVIAKPAETLARVLVAVAMMFGPVGATS